MNFFKPFSNINLFKCILQLSGWEIFLRGQKSTKTVYYSVSIAEVIIDQWDLAFIYIKDLRIKIDKMFQLSLCYISNKNNLFRQSFRSQADHLICFVTISDTYHLIQSVCPRFIFIVLILIIYKLLFELIIYQYRDYPGHYPQAIHLFHREQEPHQLLPKLQRDLILLAVSFHNIYYQFVFCEVP